jgi:TM2 domain-containing membrane protein YozV
MTQGPDENAPDRPDEPGRREYGQPQYGQQPYGEQPYGQQPGGQPYPQQYNPVYGGAYGMPGAGPDAPWGRHPVTGVPYSDKQKLVAGLLQILIPLGIGRFYIGDTGIGLAQLLVTIFTCGMGALWPFIDGILILVGDKTDAQGRPLRG